MAVRPTEHTLEEQVHARADPACILGGLVPHNPLDPWPLMEVERERGRRGRGEEKEWLKEKEVDESPSNLTLDLSLSACAKSFHLGYALTSSEHLPPLIDNRAQPLLDGCELLISGPVYQ